jgi:hypothetical protein
MILVGNCANPHHKVTFSSQPHSRASCLMMHKLHTDTACSSMRTAGFSCHVAVLKSQQNHQKLCRTALEVTWTYCVNISNIRLSVT